MANDLISVNVNDNGFMVIEDRWYIRLSEINSVEFVINSAQAEVIIQCNSTEIAIDIRKHVKNKSDFFRIAQEFKKRFLSLLK